MLLILLTSICINFEGRNNDQNKKPTYSYPLHVELAQSPRMLDNGTQYQPNQYDYVYRGGVHSPPCRFSYATNRQNKNYQRDGSMESLHCDQYDTNQDVPFCRGRVKEIVKELDKQAVAYNMKLNSGDYYSAPDLRRSLRRSESERFSYFMPQISWQP